MGSEIQAPDARSAVGGRRPPRSAPMARRAMAPGGAALLFAALAVLVTTGSPLVRLDDLVYRAAATHQPGWAFGLAGALTNLGSPSAAPAALVALAAVVGWRRRSWYPLRLAATAVVLLAVAVLAGKTGFDRAGPPAGTGHEAAHAWTLGDGIDGLLAGADHGAFPSGHTTTAVVTWSIAGWLICGGRLPRGARAVVTLAATVVGASLVYAGFHWLTDVLAGGLLGALLAWLAVTCVPGRHLMKDTHRPRSAEGLSTNSSPSAM